MKICKLHYNNIDITTLQYKLSPIFPQTKHNKFKLREKRKEITIFNQLEKQLEKQRL